MSSWFAGYVTGFLRGDARTDDNILLKRDHTHRVRAETEALVAALRAGAELRRLAVAAAVLHDVGRFEQFARYQTFDDAQSADHALLGWTTLRDGGHIDWLEPETRDLLLDAVLFHNRVRLPAIADERKRAVCEILRDADKLDIWQMVTVDYRQHQGIPDRPFYRGLPRTSGISAGVAEAVAAAQPVSFGAVRNLNDYAVLQAAMAFDVNFAPSFQNVAARGILPTIRTVLPAHDAAVDEMFGIISLYVQRRAQNAPHSLLLS